MKAQTLNRPSLSISNIGPFLRDQMCEDSNRELDWLWAAEQVIAVEEIRYCLERALYINPDNGDTRRALSKLVVQPANTGAVQRVNSKGLTQPSHH